jgi:hypothetical protein
MAATSLAVTTPCFAMRACGDAVLLTLVVLIQVRKGVGY